MLIRTYPEMGGPWEVATGGASTPTWSRAGDRLVYLSGRDLFEVPVSTTSNTVRVGASTKLFTFSQAPRFPSDRGRFALALDEESFFMVRAVEPPPGIVVVQNWRALVESPR